MDSRFDPFGLGRITGLAAQPGGVAALAGPLDIGAPLDWRGLSARLVAAHDARQILRSAAMPAGGASGSFAPAVAIRMAALVTPAAGSHRFDHTALTPMLKPMANPHAR